MPSGSQTIQEWLGLAEIVPGLIVLGLILFKASARARFRGPSPLAAWNISFTSFFVAVLCILISAMVAGGIIRVAALFFPSLFTDQTAAMITNLGVLHVCFIGGALTAVALTRSAPDWLGEPAVAQEMAPSVPAYQGSVWLAGFCTFLVTLTVVIPLSLLVRYLMLRAGVPSDNQDQVETLLKAESPLKIALFSFFAVALAPVGEELIFRAGLFRYLRTRTPRWVALLLPAIIFAGPHVNPQTMAGLNAFVPLIALAVIFSIAYERTGRIAVTIIAHALFNLHTVVLVLLGLNG
jgi:membrane protease YdiL (CAAX protease family)